jgi:hypothetical protein
MQETNVENGHLIYLGSFDGDGNARRYGGYAARIVWTGGTVPDQEHDKKCDGQCGDRLVATCEEPRCISPEHRAHVWGCRADEVKPKPKATEAKPRRASRARVSD